MGVSFGDRIIQARKDKGLSRDELGKMVETSGPIIGRYERGDMVPSVEMATRIADALGVSLDFLAGKSALVVKDHRLLQRLEDIEMLPEADRKHIFYAIDNLIKAAKLNLL